MKGIMSKCLHFSVAVFLFVVPTNDAGLHAKNERSLNEESTKLLALYTNTAKPDILRNLRGNSVGCDIYLDNRSNSSHKFGIPVTLYPPSTDEASQYISTSQTFSKVNLDLIQAKVNGVSKIPSWLESGNNWQLLASHPRSNKTLCLSSSIAAEKEVTSFYKEMKKDTSMFYILHTYNALIHGTGIIAKQCGYIQAHQACETIFKFLGRKWFKTCQNGVLSSKIKWKDAWDGSPESVDALLKACPEKHEKYATPIKRHKKVFVISAGWDSNYHHFLVDSLTRLIRHLDFLIANPDIMIHIRAIEQGFKKKELVDAGRQLRERLFTMLGIDMKRVISGQIYADEVYIPKSTNCNAPLSLAFELRLIVRYFFKKSYPEASALLEVQPLAPIHGTASIVQMAVQKNSSLALVMKRRNIIIQHRPCYDVKTCDKSWRHWDNDTLNSVVKQFKFKFPDHNIVVINSHDSYWTNCMTCQIRTYANTDILVGLHGAGLTNLIFMPPDSLIIELVAQFDGRMLPVCGYHGPLAAVFGVHHYIHYWDWKLLLNRRPKGEKMVLLNAEVIAIETFNFFNDLKSIKKRI
mmetsp:Transcript_23289/g.22446  ORF Transcript_23289/g.22446 Transcript_23289/m.22446 type:complete len:578 (+) Transcript_23289:171-1904(+)